MERVQYLVHDDRDGADRQPVPDAIEPDETSMRDLGGERLAAGEGDVGRRGPDVGGPGDLSHGVSRAAASSNAPTPASTAPDRGGDATTYAPTHAAEGNP